MKIATIVGLVSAMAAAQVAAVDDCSFDLIAPVLYDPSAQACWAVTGYDPMSFPSLTADLINTFCSNSDCNTFLSTFVTQDSGGECKVPVGANILWLAEFADPIKNTCFPPATTTPTPTTTATTTTTPTVPDCSFDLIAPVLYDPSAQACWAVTAYDFMTLPKPSADLIHTFCSNTDCNTFFSTFVNQDSGGECKVPVGTNILWLADLADPIKNTCFPPATTTPTPTTTATPTTTTPGKDPSQTTATPTTTTPGKDPSQTTATPTVTVTTSPDQNTTTTTATTPGKTDTPTTAPTAAPTSAPTTTSTAAPAATTARPAC